MTITQMRVRGGISFGVGGKRRSHGSRSEKGTVCGHRSSISRARQRSDSTSAKRSTISARPSFDGEDEAWAARKLMAFPRPDLDRMHAAVGEGSWQVENERPQRPQKPRLSPERPTGRESARDGRAMNPTDDLGRLLTRPDIDPTSDPQSSLPSCVADRRIRRRSRQTARNALDDTDEGRRVGETSFEAPRARANGIREPECETVTGIADVAARTALTESISPHKGDGEPVSKKLDDEPLGRLPWIHGVPDRHAVRRHQDRRLHCTIGVTLTLL